MMASGQMNWDIGTWTQISFQILAAAVTLIWEMFKFTFIWSIFYFMELWTYRRQFLGSVLIASNVFDYFMFNSMEIGL